MFVNVLGRFSALADGTASRDGARRRTVDSETLDEASILLPVEFSPSDLLNEKVDREALRASSSRTASDDADPYYVLGACNPGVTDRALEATDGKMGGLFPLTSSSGRKNPVDERYSADEAADALREAGFEIEHAAVRPATFLLIATLE